MPLPTNIVQYKPVQPVITQSVKDVVYTECKPHPQLQHIIYCYWQLHTTQPLADSFTYRVVADGCIDVFFELANPRENFVMGFCKKYTEFSIGHQFNYIGIRFLPTMFPQLFGIDAAALSNQATELITVSPPTARFITGIEQQDLHAISQALNTYFLQLINSTRFQFDGRLYEAIDLIIKNYGVINVETDLDTGISPRQLRRLFAQYIGDTPKTFSKIVRFQNILQSKPSVQSLRQHKLFFDAGYYDQAHFIKEFKELYGVTPTQAFGRE